jgi:hypothetical protein
MTLHPKEQMQALFAARKREDTDEFKDTYRHRAGIEGTHSQGVQWAYAAPDGMRNEVAISRQHSKQ